MGTSPVVIFDVGMTLLHPATQELTDQLAQAISTEGKALEFEPPGWLECMQGLQLALEADDELLPTGTPDLEKIAGRWALYLKLPRSVALAALRESLSRDLLYRVVDPEAMQVLATLQSAGVKIVALSNNEGRLSQELAEYRLLSYFDAVIDSQIYNVRKPDPAAVLLAVDMAGGSLRQTAVVGDGFVNDYICGVAAGVATPVLYDRYGAYGHLPVRKVARLGELLSPSVLPLAALHS